MRASTEVREDRGVGFKTRLTKRRIQGWLAGSFRSPTGATRDFLGRKATQAADCHPLDGRGSMMMYTVFIRRYK